MTLAEQFHHCYSSLSEADGLQLLCYAANQAPQIEDLLQHTWLQLGLPIIVTDALHYVIGVSEDVRKLCGPAPDWATLMEHRLAPPYGPAIHDSGTVPPPPTQDILLGKTLKIHPGEAADSSAHYIMCDIIDGSALLLKLTVSGTAPFTDPQIRQIILLANALYLSYFRLRDTTGALLDRRRHALLSLLRGEAGAEGAWPYRQEGLAGPFRLACVDMQQMGFHDLGFLTFLEQELPPGFLAVQDRAVFTILIPGGGQAPLLERLDAYCRAHHFFMLISPAYDLLAQTREQYQQLQTLIQLSALFQDCCGVAQSQELRLYAMLERLFQADPQRQFLLEDARVLLQYDQNHSSDFLQTLFCWLLYDRKSTAAAKAMYVHRNTMDNRIARIKSLLQGSWTDFSYNFGMLYSAYTLLREQRMLPFYPGRPST